MLQVEASNDLIYTGSYVGQTELGAQKPHIIESINPATGQVLAKVACADAQAYDALVNQLSLSAQSWAQVPAPKRGEVIRQVGNRLRENKADLAKLVSQEMGKSYQEGLGEVQEMIDIADFAVGQSRMLYGKTMHSERVQHRMYEQWHPYGVVGVISAFNFPVAVWAWNAFIAAICGNVVLWKPSSKTPLCALMAHKICAQVVDELGYPPIFGLLISHEHSISEQLLDDTRLPMISFTGSTRIGKEVAARVGARLGKSILELGGNNAIIVDETADLSIAIPAIVFGAVGTAGQRCTSTRRVFVHESIYDSVLDKLHKAYGQLRIGDPLDESNHMGPLIDEAAVSQYQTAIEELKSQNANILYGGSRLDMPGYYVMPTLVSGIENSWPLVQRETFAPILYVMPFSNFEQAIHEQNNVKQGLSSALFSNDVRHTEQYLSAIGSDCGIANINIGTSGAEIGGAFGGEKETGGGRESGSDAWKGYMRRQTNTINWGSELPLAQGINFQLED